jgi:hypothetical protein
MATAADRWPRGRGLAGLAGLGLAVCCALPVLASAGAGVTVAGVGLRSWLLGGAGLVIAGVGLWRYRRRAGSASHGRSEGS